ncbi:MAG: hypothetical protein P8Y53_17820 [Pseudolabrys sp.]
MLRKRSESARSSGMPRAPRAGGSNSPRETASAWSAETGEHRPQRTTGQYGQLRRRLHGRGRHGIGAALAVDRRADDAVLVGERGFRPAHAGKIVAHPFLRVGPARHHLAPRIDQRREGAGAQRRIVELARQHVGAEGKDNDDINAAALVEHGIGEHDAAAVAGAAENVATGLHGLAAQRRLEIGSVAERERGGPRIAAAECLSGGVGHGDGVDLREMDGDLAHFAAALGGLTVGDLVEPRNAGEQEAGGLDEAVLACGNLVGERLHVLDHAGAAGVAQVQLADDFDQEDGRRGQQHHQRKPQSQ